MRRRARLPFLLGLLAAVLLGPGARPAAAQDLRIGLASQPSSIDPHYHNLTPNNGVARHIFDRLVDMDEKGQLQPGLAQSWRTIDDTTWEFKLRPGVKWHDGTPLTVEDIAFTFDRAGKVPNSPSSFGIYTRGKTVKKIDDLTFHILTDTPYPLVPNELAGLSIVSRKYGENARTEDYNSGKAAIGTGPYRLVEFTPGDKIVLEGVPDHWRGKPRWARVTLKTIVSGPTRISALLAGDVDVIEEAPTQDIARLKTEPNISVAQGVSVRIIYLAFEHAKEPAPFVTDKAGNPLAKNPFKDLRVRQAMTKAINRQAIVDRVMEGAAIPASQFLPDGLFGVSPNLKVVAYDPEGAKKLLAEAGYPQGFGVSLFGPNGRYVNDGKVLEAVGQMLTRIGIDTKVEALPPANYFSRAARGEFPLRMTGWGSSTGEVSSPLKSFIATTDIEKGMGPSNPGHYSNPAVDKLLDEALATVDDAKRKALLERCVEMAIEDVAIVPLHYQVNTWAARRGFAYRVRTDEATLAMDVVPQ